MLVVQHGGFYGVPPSNAFNVGWIEHHFSGCGEGAQRLHVSMYTPDGAGYVSSMPSFFEGRDPFWSPFFPSSTTLR